jgi:DNA-binding NarL/FixJ family response regulator
MTLLTSREKQVLEFVAQGFKNSEIACNLFISQTTVISHKENIQKKLNAKNSCQMVAIAIRMGLI